MRRDWWRLFLGALVLWLFGVLIRLAITNDSVPRRSRGPS